MDSSTFTPDNVKVYRLNSDGSSTSIALAPAADGLLYDAKENSLRIKTTDLLEEGIRYRVDLFADQNKKVGIKDKAGNVLTPSPDGNVYTWRFTADSPYTIGGTVSGLVGTLVLQNNTSDELTIGIDGSFVFSAGLPKNSTYDVTVVTQPLNQNCSIENGTGLIPISATAVKDVAVFCRTKGSVDTDFGTNGVVVTAIGNGNHSLSAMVIQPDTKVVVAGTWSNSFALARYMPNGKLDPGFGANGIVTTSFGVNQSGGALAVAIQSDNKIVAAGTKNDGNFGGDFILIRYNPNGSLDDTFDGDTLNGNGIVITNATIDYDKVHAVAIQTDGKIVAAGQGAGSIILIRYNSNGTLDTTFGNVGRGSVTTKIGSWAYPKAMVIQADGKIVVAGSANTTANSLFESALILVRYLSDGKLDLAFGVDGIITTLFSLKQGVYKSVSIQSDNKIVALGSLAYGTENLTTSILFRYDSNGKLDDTFATKGMVNPVYDISAGYMAIDGDGKFVLAGCWNNGTNLDFALVRYNIGGNLDTDFGIQGKVTTTVRGNTAYANVVATQADGKIVAAGAWYNGTLTNTSNGPFRNYEFALVRYWP